MIDNKSTDGSKDFFAGRFINVNFIWNPANTGFSKANNQALEFATGEYILFLNPDTILPEDCIEKSLSFFRHRHNAGAMGIRMIDGSGNFLKESKRAFPSPFISFCKLSGLTTLFPRSKVFARYYLGTSVKIKTMKWMFWRVLLCLLLKQYWIKPAALMNVFSYMEKM